MYTAISEARRNVTVLLMQSNFPPDKASCSYTVLWNAFKRIALGRNATEEELTALFGGTAKRVYKIGEYAPEPED